MMIAEAEKVGEEDQPNTVDEAEMPPVSDAARNYFTGGNPDADPEMVHEMTERF